MSDWYDVTGAPATSSQGSSATIRAEFVAIAAGLTAKLPDLTAKGNFYVKVNSPGTALESIATITVEDATNSTSATTGSIQTDGGLGVVLDTNLGGTLDVVGLTTLAGAIRVDDVTESTSTITGSVQTDGGLGVVKNVNIGGSLEAAGIIASSAGTVSAPGIATVGDKNSGIFWPAPDEMAFSAGGVQQGRFNSTGLVMVGGAQLFIEDGTVGAPGLSFNSDGNSGVRRIGADNWALVSGGADAITIDSSQNIIFSGGDLAGSVSTAARLLNEAPSATNPTVIPNKIDNTTGIGSIVGGGTLEMVVGGINALSIAANTNITMAAASSLGVHTLINTASDSTNIQINGSTSNNTGANLQLFGATGTGAGDFTLRTTTTNVIEYDHSANLLALYSEGGSTSNGAALLLHGAGGGASADNFQLSSSGSAIITYDADNATSKLRLSESIATSGSIRKSTTGSSLQLSGSTTDATGANIILQGSGGAATDGDFHLRDTTTDIIHYDSSLSLVEFHKDVDIAGSFTMLDTVNEQAFTFTSSATTFSAASFRGDSVTAGSVVSIGSSSTSTTSRGILDVDQLSTAAVNAPVIKMLQEADTAFIDFTTISSAGATTSDAISTLTTSGSVVSHVQVRINGTKRWIAILDDPS